MIAVPVGCVFTVMIEEWGFGGMVKGNLVLSFNFQKGMGGLVIWMHFSRKCIT